MPTLRENREVFYLNITQINRLETNQNNKNKPTEPSQQGSAGMQTDAPIPNGGKTVAEKSKNIPGEQSKEEPPQLVTTSDPETKNPQTQSMEVHKHPHHVTHKKKWGEYLLEFLMIFLAVFLGFLAENIREDSVEKHREKQYMSSMIKDLSQDIKNIDADITNRKMKHLIADSIAQLLLQKDYESQTSYIYFCARRFSIVGYIFHITDGTLMQLKNSGGLRLIHKQDVVDSLQGYYNLTQQQGDNRELEMLQLRDYRDVMVRMFDVRVFEEMIKNFPITAVPQNNPALLNKHLEVVNELLMRVQLSKRINLVNLQQLMELKRKATELISQIKKEYRI